MALPIIRATGSASGANSPGVAARYKVGETITFDDTANVSGAYTSTIEDAPPAQSTALAGAATATPSLLIDAGTELETFRFQMVRATATGDEVGELLFSIEEDIVAEPGFYLTGHRLSGYLERDDVRAAATEAVWNEGGNDKGWHPDDTAALKALILRLRQWFKPDNSGGPVTVNLPAISALNDGVPHVVVDSREAATASNITIAPDGSDTIATAPTSLDIDADGGAVTLMPDFAQTAWMIVGGQGFTAA